MYLVLVNGVSITVEMTGDMPSLQRTSEALFTGMPGWYGFWWWR